MKNFKNYTPEKYSQPDFQKIEDGIYRTKNPYKSNKSDPIFVTSLSFEMEPECYGEEGGGPRDITQTPFEDLLDQYLVYITDFYEQLNENSETICYQEFGSPDLSNIQGLRTMIGKRFYAVPCDEDSYSIVIEEAHP